MFPRNSGVVFGETQKMAGFRVGFKFQEFDSRPKVMIQTQKEIYVKIEDGSIWTIDFRGQTLEGRFSGNGQMCIRFHFIVVV